MIDRHGQDDFLTRATGHLFRRLQSSFVILLSLIATYPACSSEANRPGENPESTIAITEAPVTRVSFQTLDKGPRSGVRDPLQTIVRDAADWNALWQIHTSIKPNPPPAPAVDFSRDIIAGVFAGEKPTGGYDVEILRTEKGDVALIIYYRERSPLPGGIVTQALTQSFHIVKVLGAGNLAASFRRAS
jgi:protease stability complex PrcB-like protein